MIMRIPTIIFILFLSLTVVAQVDVTHQSLFLKVDWRGEALMGSTTLTMKLLKQTETLRLDGQSLAIAWVAARERLEFEYDPAAAKDHLVLELDPAEGEGDERAVTTQ